MNEMITGQYQAGMPFCDFVRVPVVNQLMRSALEGDRRCHVRVQALYFAWMDGASPREFATVLATQVHQASHSTMTTADWDLCPAKKRGFTNG